MCFSKSWESIQPAGHVFSIATNACLVAAPQDTAFLSRLADVWLRIYVAQCASAKHMQILSWGARSAPRKALRNAWNTRYLDKISQPTQHIDQYGRTQMRHSFSFYFSR